MSRFDKPWFLWTWEDLGETPEDHDYTDECMECGRRTEDCTPCEREYKPDYRRRTTRYVCEACWPDHVADAAKDGNRLPGVQSPRSEGEMSYHDAGEIYRRARARTMVPDGRGGWTTPDGTVGLGAR